VPFVLGGVAGHRALLRNVRRDTPANVRRLR
jgi:hypothetical protein